MESPHPEVVVLAGRTFLNEGSVVGGDVSVVRVALQHVDLQFDLLLLVLHTSTRSYINTAHSIDGFNKSVYGTAWWSGDPASVILNEPYPLIGPYYHLSGIYIYSTFCLHFNTFLI